MTKREYLKSIGYQCFRDDDIYVKYQKFFTDNNRYFCALYIKLEPQNTFSILWNTNLEFESQKDIDNLQIAFNNVKRDFKEMQKYD